MGPLDGAGLSVPGAAGFCSAQIQADADAPSAQEGDLLAVRAPGDAFVVGRIAGHVPGRVFGCRPRRRPRCTARWRRSRPAGRRRTTCWSGRPFVVDHLHVLDDRLLIAAVGAHRPQLAGPDCRPPACRPGMKPRAENGVAEVGQLFGLEAMGLDQLGMLGVVGLQQVDVIVGRRGLTGRGPSTCPATRRRRGWKRRSGSCGRPCRCGRPGHGTARHAR